MEFAYSCGLTEYSTAWLEIWILHSWTAGKGEGKRGELSPEGQWESMWVVVALYGEWAYRCHARQWRDITSEGREGLEDQENGTEKTSAQDSVEKGALCSPGEGPRESIYWKMLKVSLCASDFSSQRQKWGGGEESFEGPSLPIVLMPFDGRGEKKSNMSQNQVWAFKCW